MMITKERLASCTDYTILKATATREQISILCQEAIRMKTVAVCVNPCYVKQAVKELQGSTVKVCTVIGFPLGANTSAVKAFETREAIQHGAVEIDMVMSIGALKVREYELVRDDIRAVVNASNGATVKVIIETCYLSDEEKIRACKLAKEAGADYVKTSTGFGTGGANIKDIKLMATAVGNEIGVKASGGIKTLADAIELMNAGASRLGISDLKSILAEMN